MWLCSQENTKAPCCGGQPECAYRYDPNAREEQTTELGNIGATLSEFEQRERRYAELGKACESNGLGWWEDLNGDGKLEMRFQAPADVIEEAAYSKARTSQPDVMNHPLYATLMGAIEQAMHGKGQRHGGNVTPFLEQPIFHYYKMHGRGFVTGQAAKKLEEAASTRQGQAFIDECLGAIVYIGAAIIKEKDSTNGK